MNSTRFVLAQSNNGHFTIREEALNEPAKGYVLIKVAASCISPGTELNGLATMPEPTPRKEEWHNFGYQNAGTIVAIGERCPPTLIGQRVAVMGASAHHATYTYVPVNLVCPLPDNVSYHEGSFIALATTALNAVRRAELQLGENVLVMGLGLVGQFTAQLARIAGAHVLGIDKLSLRLKAAQKAGIDGVCDLDQSLVDAATEITKGYGMDCGFICFGGDATQAFQQMVKTMKRSPDLHLYGRVVVVGGATIRQRFGSGLGNMDIRSAARTGPGYHDPMYEIGNDYPNVFVPWTTKRNMAECISWISTRHLIVQPLITHIVPLAEGPRICRTIIENPGETLGVVLTME